MKTGVNLLPWRYAEHQKRLKKWRLNLIAWISILLVSFYLLAFFQDILATQSQQKQTYLKQLTTELSKVNYQVNTLNKQPIQKQQLSPLNQQLVFQLMTLLADMPLKQGELTHFSLENQKIILQGTAENHSEFDDIQGYLHNKQDIKRVDLVHFQPEPSGLMFRFHLEL
ncbi:TPA: hypothetical protein QB352_001270 [Pasteurella multocida]|nr:hypothetical protein [Pasteurella multocida]